MKVQCFLEILDLLGSQGYFVRTKLEKQIFKDLLVQGFVYKKAGTKYCYLLTSEGKKTLIPEHSPINNDLSFLGLEPHSTPSQEEIRKLIKNTLQRLVTPLRPMVRIPDLWVSLKRSGLNDSERQLFEHTLLEMHTNNEITLHEGFSLYEANNGIQSSKDQYYYYIIIES